MSDTSNKPAYLAYVVAENGDKRKNPDNWTKIGAAFPHRDGNGFNIVLEALPVSGRVVLRRPKQ